MRDLYTRWLLWVTATPAHYILAFALPLLALCVACGVLISRF